MVILSQSDNIPSADSYITDINTNVSKNKMPTQTCLEILGIFLGSFNMFISKVNLFSMFIVKVKLPNLLCL